MKKFSALICLVLCLAMLTACGSSKGTSGSKAPAAAPTEAPAYEAPAEEPAYEAPAAQDDSFTRSASFKALKETLNDTMRDYNPQYEYDAENKICYIYFTAPSGTAKLLYESPNAIRTEWNNIVVNMASLSSTGRDLFKADGQNVNCCIMLLSDANSDKVLLGVMNGEVLYDVLG